MSGIELAGLVLGAFPIILTALERYREGAELLSDWWHIEQAYKKCTQEVKYHRLLFESNVEEFLLPLVVDDDELKLLMENQEHESWDDPELEIRLEKRLPKSYTLFIDIMKEIQEQMAKLMKAMGVNDPEFQRRLGEGDIRTDSVLDANPAKPIERSNKSSLEYQAKRIRFSLRKSSRDRIFTKLKENNDKMRRLLECNDRAVATRSFPKSTFPAPYSVKGTLEQFWSHAQKLHQALSNAWQCGCSGHQANLKLEHRVTSEVEFEISFKRDADHEMADGWKRQVAKIKLERVDRAPKSIICPLPSLGKGAKGPESPSPLKNEGNRPAWLKKKGRSESAPALRKSLTSATTHSSRPTVRWSDSDTVEATLPTSKEDSPILDLCCSLSKKSADCFGFLEEEDSRFFLYPPSKITSTVDVDTTTLKSILNDSECSLTRRQRYHLALTLASSFLQLSSTPWLEKPLDKDHIIFFLTRNSTPEAVVLDEPFICHDFVSRQPNNADRTLSYLGIRLLELCFGKPLETHSIRRQLPEGDDQQRPILDYTAALLWSKAVGDEAGPQFQSAIDWCLRESMNGTNWRKEILKNVIMPLEECHNHFRMGAASG